MCIFETSIWRYSVLKQLKVLHQVQDVHGNKTQFKIKTGTALKKLMATYCERNNLDFEVSELPPCSCLCPCPCTILTFRCLNYLLAIVLVLSVFLNNLSYLLVWPLVWAFFWVLSLSLFIALSWPLSMSLANLLISFESFFIFCWHQSSLEHPVSLWRGAGEGIGHCCKPGHGRGRHHWSLLGENSFLIFYFCSSQPSIVHWLSSSIFPCLVVVPPWWHPTKSPLLLPLDPQTHTFSESLW